MLRALAVRNYRSLRRPVVPLTDLNVVTGPHSPMLIDALQRSARTNEAELGTIELVKEFGETVMAGRQSLDEPSWHWPKR